MGDDEQDRGKELWQRRESAFLYILVAPILASFRATKDRGPRLTPCTQCAPNVECK